MTNRLRDSTSGTLVSAVPGAAGLTTDTSGAEALAAIVTDTAAGPAMDSAPGMESALGLDTMAADTASVAHTWHPADSMDGEVIIY